MTVADLLILVRRKVNDLAAVRWPDAVLLTFYNSCRWTMWSRKPFVFYVSSFVQAYPGDVSSTAGNIDFEEIWVEPVVCYLCYKCYEEDSEDANMQALAKANLDLFQGELS